MDLETLREEIRKKDSMIIELIAERTALAEEIAKVKIETNEPLRNLEVEKKVITRYIDEGVSKGLSADMMKTVASALITEAGVPIAAPSANLSGRPSPTSARHVCDDLDGRIDAIIGGADCQVGIESTVVDMTGSLPVVLRPGIITQEQLSVALGKPVGIDPALLIKPETNRGEGLLETAEEFKPKSPGMKYKHYAPKAEMIIYKGDREKTAMAMAEEKLRRVENGQKVEVIMYDDAEPEKAAREFFAKLRACDKAGVDVILAAALKEDGVGFAVMNRMFKSAGYNIIEV